jgi:hypothetical protein
MNLYLGKLTKIKMEKTQTISIRSEIRNIITTSDPAATKKVKIIVNLIVISSVI